MHRLSENNPLARSLSEFATRPSSEKPIPLFVLGVARSGTTYLHHLLADHPRIRMSYEGGLVREGPYYYERCQSRLGDRAEFDQLLDRFAEIDAEEKLNAWLVDVINQHRDALFVEHQANPSFENLVEFIYMKPQPVPCWGNKMLRVEACPDLMRRWPDAKIVILVRDPRAVYASQQKFFNTRLGYSAVYWNSHTDWTWANAVDPRRFLVFKYEEFVEAPERFLDCIFQATGVYDPAITRKILEAQPPHRQSVDKWRESLSQEQIRQIEELCFEEMQRYGYTPEFATGQKRLGSLKRGWEMFREYGHEIPWDLDWWRRKRVLQRFLRTIRG